ncbi:hypothetical protein [Sorangium sp. So ce513]|uniref:hypothetical protein n=1 Tax=Sorangium sp. So ce513 TaxID=3133315 RepID=UPI003F63C756
MAEHRTRDEPRQQPASTGAADAHTIEQTITRQSSKAKDHVEAATYLNGLNDVDIGRALKGQKAAQIAAINAAAETSPGLGKGSNVDKLTKRP